jgi:hypothetical protein
LSYFSNLNSLNDLSHEIFFEDFLFTFFGIAGRNIHRGEDPIQSTSPSPDRHESSVKFAKWNIEIGLRCVDGFGNGGGVYPLGDIFCNIVAVRISRTKWCCNASFATDIPQPQKGHVQSYPYP